MRNECTDKVTKLGGAARRRFHAIREKPEAPGAPPPEIGLRPKLVYFALQNKTTLAKHFIKRKIVA